MRYPRIYSINTVGILKHYNQDYLLHQIRTDFTGDNGVGKSIIADLFQLIFISDRKHVVFGTEGLKKDERQIHSLPLSCSEAYAFLNIEIGKGSFVTIGVCIPSSQSRQLKPFIILRDIDHQKDLSETAIPKEKLVTHRHFIADSKIPVIEDLAKHLRDRYQLFLKYYTYKEEKADYYSFLFNKKILPINLSIEDNLTAFAKIIQSFSRARSLDVNSSTSLKKFLFEDSEKLYEKLFQNHKADLAKLLSDYKSLDEYIKDLVLKQDSLSDLSEKEQLKNEKHRIFLGNEVRFLRTEKQNAELLHKRAEDELQNNHQNVKRLKERQPRLDAIVAKANTLATKYKLLRDDLQKYRAEYKEYLNFKVDLDLLTSLNIPSIAEEPAKSLDIDTLKTVEIVKRVELFNDLLSEYKSLILIRKKFDDQLKAIDTHKKLIGLELDSLKEIVKLLELRKSQTLFSKVLENKQPLSAEQEAVLFALISVLWERPKDPVAGMRYTSSLDILNAENIEVDKANDGFWFKNGNLNTFFNNRKDARLFVKTEKLQQAVNSHLADLKAAAQVKESELAELEMFMKGQPFDAKKLTLPVELDNRLKDYTALAYVEETASIILGLPHKLQKLKEVELQYSKKLSNLQISLPGLTENQIDQKIDEIGSMYDHFEARQRKLSDTKITENRDLENLENKVIPLAVKQVEDKQAAFNSANLNFIEKDTYARKFFPELRVDYQDGQVIQRKQVVQDEEDFNTARENYVTEYKSLVNRSEEAKNNPEIIEQLEKSIYGFSILEKVLLGPKIKHVNNIATVLRDANESRLRMADTIHETMLKIFSQTKSKYESYKAIVRDLNTFFKGKKISNRHYFQIHFKPQTDFNIDWITKLQASSQRAYKKGELPFGDTVEQFVEDFFKSITNYKKRIYISDLLDPKTYFDLSVSLTDENNKEIPGSTGETYSAIVLLGIGRLSIVQDTKREGIKFIILEETANLDKVNFNTFPNIAEEFGYQIITMTPKPYGSDSDKGWYLHHLMPGVENLDINYPDTASYFKTNDNKQDLTIYLQAINQ